MYYSAGTGGLGDLHFIASMSTELNVSSVPVQADMAGAGSLPPSDSSGAGSSTRSPRNGEAEGLPAAACTRVNGIHLQASGKHVPPEAAAQVRGSSVLCHLQLTCLAASGNMLATECSLHSSLTCTWTWDPQVRSGTALPGYPHLTGVPADGSAASPPATPGSVCLAMKCFVNTACLHLPAALPGLS